MCVFQFSILHVNFYGADASCNYDSLIKSFDLHSEIGNKRSTVCHDPTGIANVQLDSVIFPFNIFI